jgi:hypothetical protein
MAHITLVKASGDREAFRKDKLLASLERAGADSAVARRVADRVISQLRDGMSTRELYRAAFKLLRKEKTGLAARYNLKQAIFALGPSGFPFERFISRIFAERGYATEVGKMLRGRCVTHEVDVVATKNDQHLMVECKFHRQGVKTNVKTALYVKARFDDIREADRPGSEPRVHEGWLVTNTKLTSEAITYARCSGVKAVGWGYPERENLQQLIEATGLHPLTCLTSLSAADKTVLLEQGIVLCVDVERDFKRLSSLGFSDLKIHRVRQEISEVCSLHVGI